FPFGETWVEEHSNKQRTPYLFTAKELDEASQLYYFGARYYDPRTSVWQSPDPILEKYMPHVYQKKLVSGGIYKSANLGLYGYSHHRPIIAKDPDGNFVFITIAAVGAAITAYETYQTYNEAGGGSEGLKAAGQSLAVGGVITLATGAIGKLAHSGYKAYKGAKAARNAASVTNNTFDLAKSGGKHSGFLKNNMSRTSEELQKGVSKLQKQIETHEALIKNPAGMMKKLGKGDWNSLDPRQQKALLEKKWPSDIQRQREQQSILQGILDERG
ncbi:MAG: RHS repeat-associated core domain-containing protein, partial [Pseudomonadota bacterium]|nr:RHS repeat-associated core domain-containing protein [Pseudomonadota bacterium]